ncbi:hypothetical protein BDW42DRAFT_194625 [Aspergillus taichungensis]|uniref:FAD/NAD(P)-binding domain-containing protein n=1 Tax=Aspergillus taichungensis TaxID=482145 RepID=A0A2J5HSI2_9EURO|nr:hypothetical protein BDW42DRAFT_194625 [Aspergillus taichungensis]
MARVLIIGAGKRLYGLVAAKTYLQVTGAYDVSREDKEVPSNPEVPPAFTSSCFSSGSSTGSASTKPAVLIIDAARSLGGTWAQERLYPNLLSQNSYGLYEYSDLSLKDALPDGEDFEGEDLAGQFIPGWKIHRYLQVWCEKWALLERMRLGWRVVSTRRLPTGEWEVGVTISGEGCQDHSITLICDKLILATGLTSEPNVPVIPDRTEAGEKETLPRVHAKEVGRYCRENLGYRPIPRAKKKKKDGDEIHIPGGQNLRTVVVQGGAKSSFDFVHLFASLHRDLPSHSLDSKHPEKVQIHWVIREKNAGLAWMAPPESKLPNGRFLPSDKAASTRLMGMLTPCVYNTPKRIGLSRPSGDPWGWRPRVEGTWWCRLFHGNPVGRFAIRQLWTSIDRGIKMSAGYDSDSKMEKLRPGSSVIDCAASGGIANHPNFWETLRGANVHVHRADITEFTGLACNPTVHLDNGDVIPDADLIVHATGWKPVASIPFEPASLAHTLGLACSVETLAQSPCEGVSQSLAAWENLDWKTESKLRRVFDTSTFRPLRRASETTPYRLFRRMVSPSLAAQGDRSFVMLGVVLSSTVAVVAEVQALWAAAFLTGSLDGKGLCCGGLSSPLRINEDVEDSLREAVSEDVVWGRLTGSGLDVDAIYYNDVLLRDLGLNPYRLGRGCLNELMGTYGPTAYAGIVDEWMHPRGADGH